MDPKKSPDEQLRASTVSQAWPRPCTGRTACATGATNRATGIFRQPAKMTLEGTGEERDEYIKNDSGNAVFERAVSRCAGHGNFVQRLAAGSSAAHADE